MLVEKINNTTHNSEKPIHQEATQLVFLEQQQLISSIFQLVTLRGVAVAEKGIIISSLGVFK